MSIQQCSERTRGVSPVSYGVRIERVKQAAGLQSLPWAGQVTWRICGTNVRIVSALHDAAAFGAIVVMKDRRLVQPVAGPAVAGPAITDPSVTGGGGPVGRGVDPWRAHKQQRQERQQQRAADQQELRRL